LIAGLLLLAGPPSPRPTPTPVPRPAQKPTATPRPAPARADLSWEQADALARKLEALQATPRDGRGARRVLVTQGELNSYLNLTLGPELPPSVADLEVRLEPGDRLSAGALVDLDAVRSQVQVEGAFNPLNLLSGRVPVELRGRLQNGNGVGTLDLEDVRLGGFRLPKSLVAQLVASSTRSASSPQGFDIEAPFRLPWKVKRVRIGAGQATLEL
jgi:hypothetical protein